MIRTQINRVRHDSMERFGFGPQEMKKIKVCTACGAMASAMQFYCRECGEKLPAMTLYQTYKERHGCCAKCDIVVSDQTQFCPQCGARIIRKNEKVPSLD